ncbi:hypothetical protein D3C80_2031350 [compost metagenome]
MVDGFDAVGEVLGRGQQFEAILFETMAFEAASLGLIVHRVGFAGGSKGATLARPAPPCLDPA